MASYSAEKKIYMGKGHLTSSFKATYDLEKPPFRLKLCMAIEDIYMHYIYDHLHDEPYCIRKMRKKVSK